MTKGKYRKSKEHRQKISEALKGRSLSEKHKKKISETMSGRELTKEHKEKISETLKGRSLSDEHKRKLSESLSDNPPMRGRTHTKRARQKISEANKGKIVPNSKTNKKERKKIVELFLTGNYSEGEIADMFGLNQENVSSIVTNKVPEGRRKQIVSKILSKKVEESYAKGDRTPAKTNLYDHGHIYSQKNDREMYYRSSYEKKAIELLEKDDTVVKYFYEHLKIPYENGVYFPDFFVICKGKNKVIEVKPKGRQTEKDNTLKFQAGRNYCQEKGLKFEVWSEEELRIRQKK